MKLKTVLQALHQRATHQDQALLQDLRLGEERAVAVWYQRYHPVLKTYFQNKIEHSEDIEELIQQTFMHCLKHLPLFRGESSIKTWMIKIAQHEVADFYRKKYAKKALKSLPLHDLLFVDSPHDAHETAVIVKKVLSQLSDQYRELLLLKYVDNKTVKEIALEINKTIKSVESDLFRARKEFQALYKVALYAA